MLEVAEKPAEVHAPCCRPPPGSSKSFARRAAPRSLALAGESGTQGRVLTATHFQAPALVGAPPSRRPTAPRRASLTLRSFAMLGGARVDQQDEQAEPGDAPRAHGLELRAAGPRGCRSPGEGARQRGRGLEGAPRGLRAGRAKRAVGSAARRGAAARGAAGAIAPDAQLRPREAGAGASAEPEPEPELGPEKGEGRRSA